MNLRRSHRRSIRPRTAPRRATGPLRGARTGSVTVEFAFVIGILFLLFFGLIEVARFHVVRHSLDQAAYEGARAGIIVGSTANAARTRAQQILSATGIRNPTIDVTPAVISETTRTVTIRIRANYSDNSWCAPRFFASTQLTAETTLDHENVASTSGS